jgi:hypothetical protein
MRSELRADFDAILKPKLVAEGFQRINLDGCIKNEELWRKGRLWFGSSFDWRDRYFEADLGHLYWFRDVMPRVIVLGNYAAFARFDPMRKFSADGLASTLEAIRDSFSDALATYEEHYSKILEQQLNPKKGRYSKEYFAALGHEVDDADLQQYIA